MPLFPATGAGPVLPRARRQAGPWIARLARLGYAAKGIVYLLVGGLAVLAALGRGGETTGSEGALHALLQQPLGRAWLGGLAVGLAGYTLWRLVQAATDPEHPDGGLKRVGMRLLYALSALIHAGLTLEAARLASGSPGGGGGGEAETRHWSAVVLSQPFGAWLLGAAGAGVVGFGLVELVRAYRVDLPDRLDLSGVGREARDWIVRAARLGMSARGIVFATIGFFLIRAALRFDPGQARGVGGALRSLRGQPYGPWVLGLVALGLAAYGTFMLVQARYRRIRAV